MGGVEEEQLLSSQFDTCLSSYCSQQYTRALQYQPSVLQQQQQNRLPAVGSVFHFTSARQPFSVKQDIVNSTERRLNVEDTDNAAPAPSSSEPSSTSLSVAE